MPTAEPLTPEVESSFAIVHVPCDAGVILEVHGELDIATAPALRERLTSVIAGAPALLVVDLQAVDFFDSVSLALLLRAQKALPATSRMAVVVPPGSYARLIFEVTGVDRCLDVVATREEALAG
jgi:anti-sigma B factor antagonist